MIVPKPLIELISSPLSPADLRGLARLLVDAVESGAAVSFLPPLSVEHAEAWWRSTLVGAHAKAVFLVARDDTGITGSVQLHPAWAPNQPHRADIAKLMVHRRARRQGVATRLMQGIEYAARAAGFTLLVLDTKRGDAAEHLYRRLGWTESGLIPNYARNPDGTLHDTVYFYKELL
jgi:ribosomal protein S18 acetylase RimI-like enzyme